ncbi:hypothetical protein [Kitasatospora sp. NBC_01266]|uniref:hypothetical protein n=1 Tax=Kitasatospora sp. NBC_01266 TaxID=2903572 RepID=UPI002E337C31|nr:hypothetical protein [Kitasatospora sp. NBC_01266]
MMNDVGTRTDVVRTADPARGADRPAGPGGGPRLWLPVLAVLIGPALSWCALWCADYYADGSQDPCRAAAGLPLFGVVAAWAAPLVGLVGSVWLPVALTLREKHTALCVAVGFLCCLVAMAEADLSFLALTGAGPQPDLCFGLGPFPALPTPSAR